MFTISAIPDPVYACDVETVTGLDRKTIESAIRASRRIPSYERFPWPMDPYMVARAIVDSELAAAYKHDWGRMTPYPAGGSPTDRLSAALSANYAARMDAQAERKAATDRELAGFVAANRENDAFARAQGALGRLERGA